MMQGYTRAKAITLADTDQSYGFTVKAFYVGTGGGTLKITTLGGDAINLKAPIAGTVYRIAAKRFWSTGTTTADDIVALGD